MNHLGALPCRGRPPPDDSGAVRQPQLPVLRELELAKSPRRELLHGIIGGPDRDVAQQNDDRAQVMSSGAGLHAHGGREAGLPLAGFFEDRGPLCEPPARRTPADARPAGRREGNPETRARYAGGARRGAAQTGCVMGSLRFFFVIKFGKGR